MNQLLLGAMVPFIVLFFLYWKRGGRASLPMLMIGPVAIAASAVWAVVPDIPRALGMQELYYKMHATSASNLFYFHYSIDLVEGDSPLYAVGIVLIVVAILLAAYRELRRLEMGS